MILKRICSILVVMKAATKPNNKQKDLTIHCKVEAEVLFIGNIRFGSTKTLFRGL